MSYVPIRNNLHYFKELFFCISFVLQLTIISLRLISLYFKKLFKFYPFIFLVFFLLIVYTLSFQRSCIKHTFQILLWCYVVYEYVCLYSIYCLLLMFLLQQLSMVWYRGSRPKTNVFPPDIFSNHQLLRYFYTHQKNETSHLLSFLKTGINSVH